MIELIPPINSIIIILMGIYYNNAIYYGVIITQQQYQIINQQKHLIDLTYFQPCDQNYILHLPSTYHNFRNIDAMLEQHEIEQGSVDIDEIKHCLRKSLNKDEVDLILNPPESEKKILTELISLLNDSTIQPGFKIIQFCWTSYDTLNPPKLQHILKIE